MHLAIIMDGNRRFAKLNGLTKYIGHKMGVELLERVIDWCPKYGIDTLTVYALSTENLKREEEELKNLFDLIRDFARKTDVFMNNNVQMRMLGNFEGIRDDTSEALKNLESVTKENTKFLFQVCVNYGGRDEIIRAIKKLNESGDDVNEENLSKYLDSSLVPDLILRTGGNKRLSNFLLWQSAYSELLFLEKHWPEFSEKDLENAVKYFNEQQRRFGK